MVLPCGGPSLAGMLVTYGLAGDAAHTGQQEKPLQRACSLDAPWGAPRMTDGRAPP